MRIQRTGTEILAGDWPAHPDQTALLEARGALVAWDVLADAGPAVRVDDPDRAAEWLWEVYGAEAAAGILGDATEVTVPEDGDWQVRDACRVVAQLTWVEAWWPASSAAGVPAVSLELLHAERAIATSVIEHLLDDDEATERALATASLTGDATLDTRLVALAEDYGVVPREAAVPTREEFALAAGGQDRAAGVTVLSGTVAVDWALVPAGVVDAAANAEWAVVRTGGSTYLEVAVALVAGARQPLAARFGQVDVDLDRIDDLGRLTGRAPVPATVLLMPPAQRVLTVYAPDFARPKESTEDDRARRDVIVEYARSRMEAASATRTERTAGQLGDGTS
ncbi:hypothetical protein [Kibdelosporangium phytohabitans]|uniref:Uncharacterized protein n=1 Tax=Kibdelosporangium phytohabitans TaxID=860235 RepID=A0A0N9I563_9PSEU|nr:hypothetical protein [Kibdelosporangium phytohabitans]ALG09522.1 hypothetical protein AOZ06_23775 [Kibdelosporangium phytohabitans]MBE1469172.1 hypothetical protein [Kibdelosporangium phytohabitans]